MREMTPEGARSFLEEGTRTGKLATVRADGRPHIAPIWFILEDDHIVFTTWSESVKARNLKRDGRASLVVDAEEAPYAYVMVEGTVTMSDDPDDLLRVATANGRRYMGENRAEEFGHRNAVPGELVVRLAMNRMVAHDDVSG